MTLDDLHALVANLLASVDELRATPALPILLEPEKVAERLAVSRTTLQTLIDSGDLPVVMVTGRAVRVDLRDLEAYIKARRERRG